MNQGIHKHISLTWSRVLLLIVLAITIGGVSTAYTGETADNPPPAKAQSGNMVLMKLKLDPAISWVSSMIPVGKEDLSESHIWHTAVERISAPI
jgi:hypothetical protein